VDSTLLPSNDLVGPWRRATLVAGSIAAAEFVLLIVIGVLVLIRPLSHAIAGHAHAMTRSAPPSASAKTARPDRHPAPAAVHVPPRDRVRIMVLNGNGLNGAAARAAARLRRLGYRIAGTANAARMNYATSLVLYRPGYRSEGLRLARDLGIKVVGPLDGIGMGALRGGELAVILGA